nr:hypothetical protein CTI12_AA235510 [Tanacetum cinerariifolium]
AYFRQESKCPNFENGICESFNMAILVQRTKPIITMLEDIRLYIMQRLFEMNRVARNWDHTITPSIKKRLELLKIAQSLDTCELFSDCAFILFFLGLPGIVLRIVQLGCYTKEREGEGVKEEEVVVRDEEVGVKEAGEGVREAVVGEVMTKDEVRRTWNMIIWRRCCYKKNKNYKIMKLNK